MRTLARSLANQTYFQMNHYQITPTRIMSTRRKNHLPMTKGKRIPDPTPYRRQPVMKNDTTSGRVVVVETVHATEEIVRVSIETARYARQPEQIIVF